MLKMAFHLTDRIEDECESKLFLHLAGARQHQGTNDIQAKLSIYKGRITEYQSWTSSHS